MVNLVPRSFFAPQFGNLWDEDDIFSGNLNFSSASGITISEDDKNVYIETAVPGLDPDKIEVTFEKGTLWVRGNNETEENDSKKYYKKAATSFSYRIIVPGEIDFNTEPHAICKNGVMKVTFAKHPQVQPKKIAIKKE
jgi:HSP20 family protein